ncbi:RcpC/CpaB family pilus assembly protein [Actinocatenispora rupis]|uniref:Flp pilus assembly protein RcpC/CpaB domain-containing protein n=1 Tax=Actinocatenispora rupis TaxID=519421 RepID=A0A8J3J2D2_9ACTN|nr:RcpC/CpaB family pilus assembly protein [Actinocatenispora rupis]GID10291.1 hypothetical protein Aru02nite_11800 [Actinocatenispora rupis]
MDRSEKSAGRGRRRAERLDPVRWSPRRRGRLLRGAAVAALLLVAAGVLVSGAGPAAAERCAVHPRPTTRATAPPGDRVPAGEVGLAVTVAQPDVTGLVRPGDRVDLTVTRADSRTAEVIVRGALVLRGTPGHSADTAGDSVVYLAMSEDEARRVAGAEPSARIGVALRPG